MIEYWFAARTTGQFRYGRTYTNAQLGVTGRMAVRAGYLIPTGPPAPKRPVRRKKVTSGKQVRTEQGPDSGNTDEVREGIGS